MVKGSYSTVSVGESLFRCGDHLSSPSWLLSWRFPAANHYFGVAIIILSLPLISSRFLLQTLSSVSAILSPHQIPYSLPFLEQFRADCCGEGIIFNCFCWWIIISVWRSSYLPTYYHYNCLLWETLSWLSRRFIFYLILAAFHYFGVVNLLSPHLFG